MSEDVDGKVDLVEKTFQELWKFINARGSVITVQERNELEHVFNLMSDGECYSYLEVGSAEGNSLYVLGHALKNNNPHMNVDINYIDIGEEHTKVAREEVISHVGKENITNEFIGDSTCSLTHDVKRKYDCILIDGGHDFATVLSDSILYAPLATKYVFWHDIQLPEVRRAYEWFKTRWKIGEYSEFIHSDSFGYGILKVKT